MAQAVARHRFGFQRFPVVTAVVFAVTATVSVLGLALPSLLATLERAPAGLHGDWWRTFTALFVQDGGVAGTLSNLLFLLVMGALAEQFLERWQWLVCYFGAGLAGELAGYAWQPHGAGNSVAVCGLAGALVVVALLAGSPVPRLVPMVVLYWCGALLSVHWGVGLLVVCIVAAAAVQLVPSWTVTAGRVVAGAAIVAALALTAASDIHGAALLAGILLAAATRRPRTPASGR